MNALHLGPAAMTETPRPNTGVSPAAWSRLARQMVYAVADQLLTRFTAWQVGCTCEADGSVERVTFDVLGDGPSYERAICRRCRCPRRAEEAGEMPAGDIATQETPVRNNGRHGGRPLQTPDADNPPGFGRLSGRIDICIHRDACQDG